MDTVTSGIIPPVCLETPAVDSSMKRSRNASREKGATEEVVLFIIRKNPDPGREPLKGVPSFTEPGAEQNTTTKEIKNKIHS